MCYAVWVMRHTVLAMTVRDLNEQSFGGRFQKRAGMMSTKRIFTIVIPGKIIA